MGNVSTGREFAGMHHLELAFLDDVAPKYLTAARPENSPMEKPQRGTSDQQIACRAFRP